MPQQPTLPTRSSPLRDHTRAHAHAPAPKSLLRREMVATLRPAMRPLEPHQNRLTARKTEALQWGASRRDGAQSPGKVSCASPPGGSFQRACAGDSPGGLSGGGTPRLLPAHRESRLCGRKSHPNPVEAQESPAGAPHPLCPTPPADPPGPGRTRAGSGHLATMRSSGSGGPGLHARRPSAAASRSMLAARPAAASPAATRSVQARRRRRSAAEPSWAPPPRPLLLFCFSRQARRRRPPRPAGPAPGHGAPPTRGGPS